jgi:hypothetical protein
VSLGLTCSQREYLRLLVDEHDEGCDHPERHVHEPIELPDCLGGFRDKSGFRWPCLLKEGHQGKCDYGVKK